MQRFGEQLALRKRSSKEMDGTLVIEVGLRDDQTSFVLYMIERLLSPHSLVQLLSAPIFDVLQQRYLWII